MGKDCRAHGQTRQGEKVDSTMNSPTELHGTQEDSASDLRVGVREMNGYLMKRGRNLNMKHKRYITLKGQTLSQHKDEHSPPTWSVDVSKTRVQPGPRQCELVVHYDGREISFFADNKPAFDAWLDALRGASRTVEDWYDLGDQIGKGSYGVVHVGTDRRTGQKVAIKIIKKNPSSRRQSKFIEREVKYVLDAQIARNYGNNANCTCFSVFLYRILKSVQHKHVIQTFDVFENDEKLCLVSEFMEGGELFDRIISEKFLTEEKARMIMQQLLEGKLQLLFEHSSMCIDLY